MLKKLSFSPVIIAVILAVALLLWLLSGDNYSAKQQAPAEQQVPKAEIAVVETEWSDAKAYQATQVAQGQVLPWRSVSIKAQQAGTVEALLKQQGDSAAQGDKLLRLSDEGRTASLAQAKANLAHLYTIFPIQAWLNRTVGSLSGGQKRLVDIARAMVHKPGVLILDEPTTALDVPSKNSVWQTLKTLQAIDGLTIFIATHLMDEANSCDRVGFLHQGELSWLGTPAQALDELPDQSVTSVRTATLADWFVWKMNGGAH